MKQQHSATGLPPSRLCRLLLLAFALKLTALGMLLFEPALPSDDDSWAFSGANYFASLFSGLESSGRSTASAAEGAGAPPAITPVMPDGSPIEGLPVNPDQERGLPPIGLDAGSASTPGPSGAGQGEIRDSLARKQEDLARKEQELRVLESELSSRLEKMKMLENRLASMIKDAEETNDSKFRHLVDVLSNMKAKQAAAVLETLDPKIAVKVLAGMRGRQAGEILTFVKPTVAAQLTESLARMQLPLE